MRGRGAPAPGSLGSAVLRRLSWLLTDLFLVSSMCH